jgi:hypothetical protein
MGFIPISRISRWKSGCAYTKHLFVSTHPCHTPSHFALPIRQVSIHQAFKEFAVIGNGQVKQFVHNHDFPEGSTLAEKISTQIDSARGRARRPFSGHPLNLDSFRNDANLCSPSLDLASYVIRSSTSHCRGSLRIRSATSTILSLPTAGKRSL